MSKANLFPEQRLISTCLKLKKKDFFISLMNFTLIINDVINRANVPGLIVEESKIIIFSDKQTKFSKLP